MSLSLLSLGCLLMNPVQGAEPGTSHQRLVAVASSGSVVGYWDGKLTLIYRDPQIAPKELLGGNGAEVMAFSPDGKQMIASMAGGGIAVWDTATGRPVARLKRSTTPGRGLALSPDGTLAAVGSSGRCIEVWNLRSQTLASVTKAEQETKEMWTSEVLDARTGRTLRQPSSDYIPLRLAFSPDGRLLASSGQETHYIRVWNPATGALVREIPARPITTLAWTLDSATILDLGGIRGWNVAVGTPIMYQNGQSDTFGTLLGNRRQVGVNGGVLSLNSGGVIEGCQVGASQVTTTARLDAWTPYESARGTTALDALAKFVANVRQDTGRVVVWAVADGHTVWSFGSS